MTLVLTYVERHPVWTCIFLLIIGQTIIYALAAAKGKGDV